MSSLTKPRSNANSVFLAFPENPGVSELFELGLVYDAIFDGGGQLESTFKGAQSFAYFLDNGSMKYARKWDFQGLGVLFLDRAVRGLRSAGAKERWISSTFRDVYVIDKLDEARKEHRLLFGHVIKGIAEKIRDRYPEILQDITQFFADLNLLNDNVIEYYSPQVIGQTHSAVAKYVFEAMDLDEKDKQFARIALKADKENPYQWTSFLLNSSLMESSYLKMDLYLPDAFRHVIEYKLLRGANLEGQKHRAHALQESVSTLIPDLCDLNVRDYLEIRNSNRVKSLRKELARIMASRNLADKSMSEYIKDKYVRQLEDLAEARRPNMRCWALKTFVSLVSPIAGIAIAGLDGYREARDQFSNWKLALSTLSIRTKVERARSANT